MSHLQIYVEFVYQLYFGIMFNNIYSFCYVLIKLGQNNPIL